MVLQSFTNCFDKLNCATSPQDPPAWERGAAHALSLCKWVQRAVSSVEYWSRADALEKQEDRPAILSISSVVRQAHRQRSCYQPAGAKTPMVFNEESCITETSHLWWDSRSKDAEPRSFPLSSKSLFPPHYIDWKSLAASQGIARHMTVPLVLKALSVLDTSALDIPEADSISPISEAFESCEPGHTGFPSRFDWVPSVAML